jgi:hypothetical protein
MKIIKKNNSNEPPKVVTDLNGNIISANESAKNELSIRRKEDIAKLINIDLIKKLSMFSDTINVTKTTNNKFKEAILRASGTGLSKTIQITFSLGYDKEEKDIQQEESMISIVKTIDDTVTEINCIEASKEIIKEIEENSTGKPPFINNYSKNETFVCNPYVVQILAVSSLGIANEISPTRPINFSIKKLLNWLQIETKIAVDTVKTARTIQDIESIYPFTALKFAIIDEICEQERISYEAYITGRTLSIRFRLEEKKSKMEVHATNLIPSLLSAIVSAFSPRPNIRSKYGMPEVEIEE